LKLQSFNHFKMVEIQTSEVDVIPAPVSLGEQWLKMVKHCWATQECIVVKQWVSLLETIVELHCDRNVPEGIAGRHGWESYLSKTGQGWKNCLG
jgi:hypothetical protein